MSGIERIQSAFNTAKSQGQAAFMPYLPVGYPDLPTSLDLFQALADAGADLIEVGAPFSDPLADGPTIQAATQQALAHGVTSADCLATVRALRGRGASPYRTAACLRFLATKGSPTRNSAFDSSSF
ncbi:MAG TPA: hypothetical protein G4N94_10070 [Caldilineae bacterium]|nr:hypothetical protein [Caldilineae bacterium]